MAKATVKHTDLYVNGECYLRFDDPAYAEAVACGFNVAENADLQRGFNAGQHIHAELSQKDETDPANPVER